MKKEIVFVTHNTGKIKSAEKYFIRYNRNKRNLKVNGRKRKQKMCV